MARKLMEDRIRFIEHKGNKVLSLNFSHATAPEMIPLLDKVRATIAQQGPKSVLVLADYAGAEIDHTVAMKIKEVLTLDRPFVKKAAWINSEHIPHALMENFHFFSQRETVTFKTREDALDWLVEE
jgi:pyruvate kinase